MTTIAFIPARGGSARIPRKNLATVGGVSLLERAIGHARDSGVCDRIVVSTDDEEIAEVARANGCEVHERPAHLAGPHAQIEDAIAHWLHRQRRLLALTDCLVLLQPTSPFRRPETVRHCVELVRDKGCDSALAVLVDVRRAIFSGRVRGLYDDATGTELAKRVIWDRPPTWRPRSQDVRGIGVEAGSVYAFSCEHFRTTHCRMGGREAIVRVSWLEAFEIDEPEDIRVANALASLEMPATSA